LICINIARRQRADKAIANELQSAGAAMSFRIVLAAVVAMLIAAVAAIALSGRWNATREPDGRTAISLTEEETAFVRKEMRGLLASVQEMLDAAAAGDRERLVSAARHAGMNGPEKDHIPLALAVKLPMEFKQLGLSTHRAFDAIAADAPAQDLAPFAARRLGETMNNCTACHSTFRLRGPAEP
jgi:hypothetical protein